MVYVESVMPLSFIGLGFNNFIFDPAMDDTQRMMQMGGFGFDPTKVYPTQITLARSAFG